MGWPPPRGTRRDPLRRRMETDPRNALAVIAALEHHPIAVDFHHATWSAPSTRRSAMKARRQAALAVGATPRRRCASACIDVCSAAW